MLLKFDLILFTIHSSFVCIFSNEFIYRFICIIACLYVQVLFYIVCCYPSYSLFLGIFSNFCVYFVIFQEICYCYCCGFSLSFFLSMLGRNLGIWVKVVFSSCMFHSRSVAVSQWQVVCRFVTFYQFGVKHAIWLLSY